MRKLLFLSLLVVSQFSFSQEASVDIKLSPAGAFTGKSNEVKGFAELKGDVVTAQNIVVTLKNIRTGIALRDDHTRKHLQVDKFPEATLVSAKGQGGKGEGIIKIKGIEKKISGTYKINGKKIEADFPLKLSEFQITGIKYMGVGVKDDVIVHVSIPLK